MSIRIKKVLGGTIIIVLLLLSVYFFLVFSTTGLRLLCNVANNFISGLTIGEIAGNLHDLKLKDIHYEYPGIQFDIKEFNMTFKFKYLRNANLYIKNILLKDANLMIDLHTISKFKQTHKQNRKFVNLFIPYSLTLSHIVLNNIKLKINDTVISVSDFSSGLFWKKNNLTLTSTYLYNSLIILPKTYNITNSIPLKVKINHLKLKANYLNKTLHNLLLKPSLPKLATMHLPFNLNIEEFKGEQLKLVSDTNLVVYNFLIKLKYIDDHIQLNVLNINSNLGAINVDGMAQFNANWPIKIKIRSTLLNFSLIQSEKIVLNIYGNLHNIIQVSMICSGQVNMMLHAQTKISEVGLPFLHLEITSNHNFYCPLTNKRQLNINQFKLKFVGTISNYVLSLQTTIKGPNLPLTLISAHAKGNKYQVNFDKLTVSTLDNKVQLIVLFNYCKIMHYNHTLSINDTGLSKKLNNDFLYKIDKLFKTNNKLYNHNLQPAIITIKVTGNINNNKVNTQGYLGIDNNLHYFISNLNIRLGRNTIVLKGQINIKTLNLEAVINAPNLSGIYPTLNGMIHGYIKIYGTTDYPQIMTKMTADQLHWQQTTIAHILINTDIKHYLLGSSYLNIQISNIMQSNVNIHLLTLKITGKKDQYTFQLYIHGESISGKLHIAGCVNHQTGRWKVKCYDTSLTTPIGTWVLNKEITLDYNNMMHKIIIKPHCWNNSDIQFCLPHIIDVGAIGSIAISINCFNTSILKPFILSTSAINSTFIGKVNVNWNIFNKNKYINSNITLFKCNKIIYRTVNNISTFNVLDFNLQLHNESIKLKWLINLMNNGHFDGNIQITDLFNKRNLTGNINIYDFNLAIMNFVSICEDNKITGLLKGNLRLAGNISYPKLFGYMQFNHISIISNNIPLNLQISQLILNFQGMHSTLLGVIRANKGKIRLNGNADWTQYNHWYARISVNGQYARVIISPTIQFDISPNVVFEAISNKYISVYGHIDVPWAHIVMCEMPENIVTVSNDEVILSDNLNSIKNNNTSTSIPIHSNVILHIGNNVHINVLGLKAKLIGNLKIIQNKQGFGLNGHVNIQKGRLHAYGQDLIVRKGELIFSGPLDQPLINIEVIRNPKLTKNEVIVGIRISSLIDDPKIEIFSEPAMSQQDALSYLLRGRGLDNSQSDNATITSILVNLGVAQGNQIINKIGYMLGINNLSLDTQWIGDSSKVVVSGYLLPGLQVRYGIGIYDSLVTLTLRYRLMPNLYLEAISGVNQTLDLLYQFEF